MQRDAEVVEHREADVGLAPKHRISEWFRSVQGEGLLAGTPSVFIRYANCNLACSWCDAAYTWRGDVHYDEASTAELVGHAEGTRHVVVTGGEPTIQPGIGDLIRELCRDGHHVTVETNGTIHPDEWDPDWYAALYSVSPKLGSSGQTGDLNLAALAGYIERKQHLRDGRVQFKYVIDTEDDLDQALRLSRDLGLFGIPIIVQPNGLCHTAQVMIDGERQLTDQGVRRAGKLSEDVTLDAKGVAVVDVELQVPYLDRVRELYEMVLARDDIDDLDLRVGIQQHKLSYGNKRGH